MLGRKPRCSRLSQTAQLRLLLVSLLCGIAVLSIGNFVYINRFMDGLRLPSEDEAIKTNQETDDMSFEEIRMPENQQ